MSMVPPNIAAARPAATVIVLREGNPFEILMVRRNDKVAFMAGSYMFRAAGSTTAIGLPQVNGSRRRRFPT